MAFRVAFEEAALETTRDNKPYTKVTIHIHTNTWKQNDILY